nr:MAG TPA: hypothetical protein [Crassvirales sp.]
MDSFGIILHLIIIINRWPIYNRLGLLNIVLYRL